MVFVSESMDVVLALRRDMFFGESVDELSHKINDYPIYIGPSPIWDDFKCAAVVDLWIAIGSTTFFL